MKQHTVRTHPSRVGIPRHEELAWKLAEVAADPVPVTAEAAEMLANRVIDNAAVAVASLTRGPVTTARSQALAHPGKPGATIFAASPSNSPRRMSSRLLRSGLADASS